MAVVCRGVVVSRVWGFGVYWGVGFVFSGIFRLYSLLSLPIGILQGWMDIFCMQRGDLTCRAGTYSI